jgi:hypothetical protein
MFGASRGRSAARNGTVTVLAGILVGLASLAPPAAWAAAPSSSYTDLLNGVRTGDARTPLTLTAEQERTLQELNQAALAGDDSALSLFGTLMLPAMMRDGFCEPDALHPGAVSCAFDYSNKPGSQATVLHDALTGPAIARPAESSLAVQGILDKVLVGTPLVMQASVYSDSGSGSDEGSDTVDYCPTDIFGAPLGECPAGTAATADVLFRYSYRYRIECEVEDELFGLLGLGFLNPLAWVAIPFTDVANCSISASAEAVAGAHHLPAATDMVFANVAGAVYIDNATVLESLYRHFIEGDSLEELAAQFLRTVTVNAPALAKQVLVEDCATAPAPYQSRPTYLALQGKSYDVPMTDMVIALQTWYQAPPDESAQRFGIWTYPAPTSAGLLQQLPVTARYLNGAALPPSAGLTALTAVATYNFDRVETFHPNIIFAGVDNRDPNNTCYVEMSLRDFDAASPDRRVAGDAFWYWDSGPSQGGRYGLPRATHLYGFMLTEQGLEQERSGDRSGWLSFTAAGYTVDETAGYIDVVVQRTKGSEGTVSVKYRSVGNAQLGEPGYDEYAVAGSDYEDVQGTLVFNEGQTSKTIRIPILDDVIRDKVHRDREHFYLHLYEPTGGATLVSPKTAVISIRDNEEPNPGVLHFETDFLSIEEGGQIRLGVKRDYGTDLNVAVDYTVVPGTADTSDYNWPLSGTLEWTSGDGGYHYVTLSSRADTDVEGTETFTIVLSNPTNGAQLGEPHQVTVELRDPPPDQTPYAFSFADQPNVEPLATVTSAAVTITGINVPTPVSVAGGAYSIDCTSTFTSADGTVTNGQSVCVRHTAAMAYQTSTDTWLTIGNVQDVFTSTTRSADVTPDAFDFQDQNDVAPSTTITSASVTITGIEVTVPVSVAGGTYSIGCTATYTSAAGSIGNGQSVCVRHTSSPNPSGNVSTTLTVGGVSDTFTSATTGATDTTPDDFAFADQGNVYPNALVTSAPVTITGINSLATVTVAGGSYSIGCNGTYTSAAGQIGNNQAVCVRHTASSSYGTSVNTTLTVGGKQDVFTSTTLQPSTLAFASSAYTTQENFGTAVNVIVTRTGSGTGPVSINYATQSGTASGGSDYGSVSGTLTWADGDLSNKAISIPKVNDSTAENDEYFDVVLSAPSAGAILGSPSSTRVTIGCNDGYNCQ